MLPGDCATANSSRSPDGTFLRQVRIDSACGRAGQIQAAFKAWQHHGAHKGSDCRPQADAAHPRIFGGRGTRSEAREAIAGGPQELSREKSHSSCHRTWKAHLYGRPPPSRARALVDQHSGSCTRRHARGLVGSRGPTVLAQDGEEWLCWPIDTDGNRRPFAAIPHHISELPDNVWRSLARRVRGEAFEDEDTPFQEFIWGDYFRTFMSRRLIELQFDLAVDLATKLARLAEAEDLPGFFHIKPRSK